MRGKLNSQVAGGVTAPRGFMAAGIHAGIKKPHLLDLALVVSVCEGPIGGLFTTNRLAAAPVQLGRQHLRYGRGRAIIMNSGNANAFTGLRGHHDAKAMARTVAEQLNTPLRSVFVGSTGVIGQALQIEAILRAVPSLIKRLNPNRGIEAARAIMTTDTRLKLVGVRTRIGGHVVTIGGIAKGSGMIHPNMATMLACLTTDAVIAQPDLQRALRRAVDKSFNCITVDGDTSTNDMVLCMANGMAGNPPLHRRSSYLSSFQRLLDDACQALAMQVCRDGEGATKVVQLVVTGAKSEAEAKCAVNTVGTSSLVKTALFGEDANWGRIIAAIGRSGASVNPDRLVLTFDRQPIVKHGSGLGPKAEKAIARIVRRKEFRIGMHLGVGKATAALWTTDLSSDYVRINASYRS